MENKEKNEELEKAGYLFNDGELINFGHWAKKILEEKPVL